MKELACIIGISFIFCFLGSSRLHGSRTVTHSLYGTHTIEEEVLCELLEAPSMQRLKKIHQYGIDYYVIAPLDYNRYDHSVGVMLLLRQFGASLEEQVAGLLHDVSHTVFSHVGDHVFTMHVDKSRDGDAYQDIIHVWYIKQTEITRILARHNLTPEQILHKNGAFCMLEQDLPNICADRLEYNLYGAFLEKKLSYDQVHKIIDALRYADGKWYFVEVATAQLFAETSLYLTEHCFSQPWGVPLDTWMAAALRRALTIDLISVDDIHFGIDDVVWNQLCTSDDAVIKEYMYRIVNHKILFHKADKATHDYCSPQKFRGINPWVSVDGELRRLLVVSDDFCKEYKRVVSVVINGMYAQRAQNHKNS